MKLQIMVRILIFIISRNAHFVLDKSRVASEQVDCSDAFFRGGKGKMTKKTKIMRVKFCG